MKQNRLMRFCFRLAWGAGCSAAVVLAASMTEGPRHVSSVVRADNRTGKLVRSMVVTPRTVTKAVIAPRVVEPLAPGMTLPEPPPQGPIANINDAVERIAAQHSLPPQLLHSVIRVESNYNPMAVSSAGALGLMQLIPSTARRFGVSDVFNPVENIQGGARYLRYLLDLFNGNYPLALAAYNAGEGAVARYGGVPPYRETQNYIVSVRKRLEEAKRAEAAKMPAREIKPAETRPEGAPSSIVEVMEADGSVRYVSR
jgi:hypothetical protein